MAKIGQGHLCLREENLSFNNSAQCDGDVLPTRLRPVKIEDENEYD
jgi:hypothetical protein